MRELQGQQWVSCVNIILSNFKDLEQILSKIIRNHVYNFQLLVPHYKHFLEYMFKPKVFFFKQNCCTQEVLEQHVAKKGVKVLLCTSQVWIEDCHKWSDLESFIFLVLCLFPVKDFYHRMICLDATTSNKCYPAKILTGKDGSVVVFNMFTKLLNIDH